MHECIKQTFFSSQPENVLGEKEASPKFSVFEIMKDINIPIEKKEEYFNNADSLKPYMWAVIASKNHEYTETVFQNANIVEKLKNFDIKNIAMKDYKTCYIITHSSSFEFLSKELQNELKKEEVSLSESRSHAKIGLARS